MAIFHSYVKLPEGMCYLGMVFLLGISALLAVHLEYQFLHLDSWSPWSSVLVLVLTTRPSKYVDRKVVTMKPLSFPYRT